MKREEVEKRIKEIAKQHQEHTTRHVMARGGVNVFQFVMKLSEAVAAAIKEKKPIEEIEKAFVLFQETIVKEANATNGAITREYNDAMACLGAIQAFQNILVEMDKPQEPTPETNILDLQEKFEDLRKAREDVEQAQKNAESQPTA